VKLLIIVLAIAAAGVGALHSWHSRGLYVRAALLSEAFNLTSHVKLRVSEHYVKHGVMPHDNADAELPPAKSIYGTSVKRVAVSRGGVLLVDFEEKIGTKAMTFTPTISPVSGLLSWRCTSNSINKAVLEKLKPSCNYLPASLESTLMSAIANRDLLQVDVLLNDGARPDAFVSGNTPLMLAAKMGNLSIVKRLLEGGAHVDNAAPNSERHTPLMVAITSNHSEVVSFLLRQGASITREDYRGLTAMDHAIATDRRLGGERFVLMVAARFNPGSAGLSDLALVETITDEQLDAQLQILYGEYRRAIRACHVPRLTSLLNTEGDLLAPELVQGKPIAQYIRKPVCIDLLSEHLRGKKSYQAALHAHVAAQVQQCDLVAVETALKEHPELLVDHIYQGQSHLYRAVSSGCAAVVTLMVRSKGLVGQLPDDILVMAIKQAPQSSLIKLVGSLIAAGANVNGRSDDGQSSLAAAIALEQPVIAKYLVDAGADVNAPALHSSYPIIEATKKGYEHLVLQMVAAGANLDTADALGRTALIAAVGRDREQLVGSLIRAGANTRVRDANGIDAVLLAESRNLRQIKQMLIASTE